MDRQQVITVLESLANGIDPTSGMSIPLDAFHSPDAIRALFVASSLLRSEAKNPKHERRGGGPQLAAAGSSWSRDEDARVCHEFDSGMTVAQIALQHGRTSGAITSRLVKLGRIDPATVKSRDRGARVS